MHSIKHNFETGFVWDNDQFSTNLFAHPYHGGLYFNSARSNGMSFWESIPYALCGSLMWEFCGETEPPAINDVMATTLGGVAIGEITNRVSALVLDDRAHGFSRFLRELAGTLINPIQGFNRIVSGKAWKVRRDYYKYHDYQGSSSSFQRGNRRPLPYRRGRHLPRRAQSLCGLWTGLWRPLRQRTNSPLRLFHSQHHCRC